MKLFEKLAKSLNLSAHESSVYLALQNNGPMHIQNIGKVSGISRTAIYPPINTLREKGLVSETIFGKRKFYSATPLENLKKIFEERKELLDEVITEVASSRIISSERAKLDTVLYSGKEGMRAAGIIFLDETEDKTWYSFENLGLVSDRVGFEFENFYINERIKKGIRSKMILSVTEETEWIRKILREDKKQLRETVLLSPHQYPFKTTICITKGLVLLVSPGGNPFALVIRNKDMAETFMNIHKCLWDRYR